MTFALKSGYSKTVVMDNIAVLLREHYPRGRAIVLAFNAGRASYFKKHPEGALPEWLAYPKGRRLALHYNANGEAIKEGAVSENPVRQLDIPPQELEEIRRGIQKQLGGKGAAVRKAAALYTDFTGHEDLTITKITVADMPKAVLAVGQVDGIMYTTVRDGVTEKYIHEFKRKARPHLLASPDGKNLYLIGGSFTFTERGIVDN